VLRLAALIPVASVSATACGMGSEPKQPDALEPLRLGAQKDSALARAVAAAHPDLADQAKTISANRDQHAAKLQSEIDRANPPQAGQKPSPPPPAPPPQAPTDSSAAKAALTDALHTAQGQSANLVPTLPTYRAGLVGSVSASCASMLEVLA
jgi:hypothetical protein